ncbi:MAG: helix-turn-helix domain-containing protein [Streptosporangiaceae bacterium]
MSIGEDLAGARRRAGLSVAQVSERTCIRKTIICGIEGDDYSACGSDFYARGHIRAIARAVGADPGPLISEYDTAHSAQAAGLVPGPTRPARVRRRRRVRSAAVLGGAVRGRLGACLSCAWRLRPRLTVAVVTGVLVVGLVVAWMGQRAAVVAPGRPGLAWALSPASNTVTIWLRPGNGPAARRVLAGSHLTVSEGGSGHLSRQFAGARMVRVPVPAGRQIRLLVQVRGPRPYRQTLTITVPPAGGPSPPRAARSATIPSLTPT